MKGIKTNILATEGIQFQSGLFAKELTQAFETLKKLPKDEIPDSPEIKTIESIIDGHTKLLFSVDIGERGPHVESPAINKNNPLIASFHRAYSSSADGIAMIKAAPGLVQGGVNLRTSQATGIFTKLQHRLALPLNYIVGKSYTAAELAAITIHEVGHIFTYYEYITRSVTTNQVLAGLAKALDGTGNVIEREAILLTAHKALRLGTEGVADLAKSNNTKVVEAVVLSNVMRSTASELGSNIYDATSWEYLSDEFATRHGAGRDLVTALGKLYQRDWNISFRSTPVFYAFEALKILFYVGNLMFGNFLPLVSMILISMPGNETYDTPEARLKRIRNQIMENLKQKDLSETDSENLREDLAAVDMVLDKANDRRDIFGMFWTTVSGSQRRAWNQQELQKQLESIAANDLFLKASAIKDLKV